MIALYAFGLFVLLVGIPNHVIPTGEATLFGDAVVAHAWGDGAWFPLVDEMIVVEDGERPVQMCAVSKNVVEVDDYIYVLRESVTDGNLELVSCVPGGVMFVEFREC